MNLENVLSYENEEIVLRFSIKQNLSFSESEQIFTETKKWLYLKNLAASEYENSKSFFPTVSSHLFIIDEMWHNFILFTEEYDAFCMSHFGRFIHHQPMSAEEWYRFKNDLEEDVVVDQESLRLLLKQQLRDQLEYINMHLGQETIESWYKKLPKKYHK